MKADNKDDIRKCLSCKLPECIDCIGLEYRRALGSSGQCGPKPKAVCVFDSNGDLYAEFASVSETALELKTTIEVVRKAIYKQRVVKGYTIRYKEAAHK